MGNISAGGNGVVRGGGRETVTTPLRRGRHHRRPDARYRLSKGPDEWKRATITLRRGGALLRPLCVAKPGLGRTALAALRAQPPEGKAGRLFVSVCHSSGVGGGCYLATARRGRRPLRNQRRLPQPSRRPLAPPPPPLFSIFHSRQNLCLTFCRRECISVLTRLIHYTVVPKTNRKRRQSDDTFRLS